MPERPGRRRSTSPTLDADDSRHHRIFSAPRCYDVAFGYRDFAAECDFLTALARRHLGREPASALELAAGPANHAVELARRGLDVQALDREPAMVAYGLEKAEAAGQRIDYHAGDMTGFTLPRPVDMALLLLGSAACLLTLDDGLALLDRVGRALVPGGLLVLELPHPRSLFGEEERTQDEWEVEQDGMRVHVLWGAPDDRFDPVSQIGEVTTVLTVRSGRRRTVIRDRARQRRWTAQDLVALARLDGGFEIVDWAGALDTGVAIDDPDNAWRMVCVLRRKSETS